MLRENYADQENPSPLRSMEHSFRAYTARRKAVEERRMSGNGLPDYAFSSDYEYRKRLDAIPHFYSVAKKICGTYASRTLQEVNMAGMLVGPEQYPEVYQMGCDCARILGIGIPNIYIVNDQTLNAYTIGTDDIEPLIVIHSGLYERVTPGELRCVIGHECGHIQNQHGIYDMLKQILVAAGTSAAGLLSVQLMNLMTQGVQFLLNAWSRAAEVTCDRAGMICSERVEDAYSVNAKLLYGAAIGDKETVNLEALKKQLEMQMGTLVRLEELFADHPAAVRRIMAEMEFARCEVFYRWRPELKEAGQSVCTKEETDERCRRYVDVIRKGK